MDYKNDNRTPRDRITGEFLSELLFTELGGDCDCEYSPRTRHDCSCAENRRTNKNVRPDSHSKNTASVKTSAGVCTDNRINNRYTDGCKNGSYNGGNVEFTGNYSLAMAYVPLQEFGDLFDIEEGFCEGTVFKALRFPFYPTPCRKENY